MHLYSLKKKHTCHTLQREFVFMSHFNSSVYVFPPLGQICAQLILTLCPHTMVYLVIQCMCAGFRLSSFGILEGNKSPDLFSCVIYCVFFIYIFFFILHYAEVYKTICTSLFNIIIFSQFSAIM